MWLKTAALRITSLAFAALAGLAAREIAGLQAAAPSALKLTALAACLVAVVALLGLALAPARCWLRLRDRTVSLMSRMRNAPTSGARAAGWLLIVLGLAAYAIILPRYFARQSSPESEDQGAYLATAQQVAAAGGPPAMVAQLFRGELAEANRHPLFIGLLSLCPTFAAGKFLSAGIGMVTLSGLTLLVVRRFGAMIGGVFCLLLATNHAFCHATTLVTAEGLLVLVSGLTWLAAGRCLTATGRSRIAWHALLGALLGLAYLTKATGLMLLVGWLAAVLVRESLPIVRSRGWLPLTMLRSLLAARAAAPVIVVTLAAFVAVSSPLLVRNVKRYGTPLYNVNSHLLFEDAFRDPAELARRRSLAEAARAYLRSHSLADMIRRELRGLVWEAFIIIRTLSPGPLGDARVIPGLVVATLAALGVLTEPRADRLLAAVWTLLVWLLFAWYVPIAVGDRFALPLLTPLLILASSGLVRLLRGYYVFQLAGHLHGPERRVTDRNAFSYTIPRVRLWTLFT